MKAGACVLTKMQIAALRAALAGRMTALCFGAGVDSTAMMVALRAAGLRPDVITMADTGGERRVTMRHVDTMNLVLLSWGWPPIVVCKKVPLASSGYTDLYGNCWTNETLPSLAFGMSSCSLKWKAGPQDLYLKGAKRGPQAKPPHPLWLAAQVARQRIVKLIGYDCGAADLRRAKKAYGASDFDYAYPLQVIGWQRADCVRAITTALGAAYVPTKSACTYCPASKKWELFWLAAEEPESLEAALDLERRALTGRHSRFTEVEFGASWEELVRNADSFPSSNTCVGLGRSFAWNQWARVEGVVDENFRVRRERRGYFIAQANRLRRADNAFDGRTVIRLHAA